MYFALMLFSIHSTNECKASRGLAGGGGVFIKERNTTAKCRVQHVHSCIKVLVKQVLSQYGEEYSDPISIQLRWEVSTLVFLARSPDL